MKSSFATLSSLFLVVGSGAASERELFFHHSKHCSCNGVETFVQRGSYSTLFEAIADAPKGCQIASINSLEDMDVLGSVITQSNVWVGILKSVDLVLEQEGDDRQTQTTGWFNIVGGTPVPADVTLWVNPSPVGVDSNGNVLSFALLQNSNNNPAMLVDITNPGGPQPAVYECCLGFSDQC